ncbi:MAG: DNA mismatch repair protein MutS, partial [Clostridia bacterium]|nr:DNA mismatch repair protein MutS [Clostridia bacterium]
MDNKKTEVEKQSDFTPMMQQYFDVKNQYNDCILMYRLGDFYEMFFDDAKTVSKELDLTLTGRACGQDERAPMCGVPFHSAEGYIARLVAKGHKVAICEQTEDPALAKGLVKREVIRLITPGTVIEPAMLDESANSFIASVYRDAFYAGLCACDVSTGETFATVISGKDLGQKLINEIGRFSPKEVLLSETASADKAFVSFLQDKLSSHIEVLTAERYERCACETLIKEHFADSFDNLVNSDSDVLLKTVGGLLSYLHETQKNTLSHIDKLQFYNKNSYMELDYNARRNLELTSTMRSGEKKGSLLWVLDNTATAAGARLIRQWIEKPLLKVSEIHERLFAVSSFTEHRIESEDLLKIFRSLCDIERISARLVYGTANSRDLKALSQVICRLPEIKAILSSLGNSYLSKISLDIDELKDVYDLIESSITDDPPFSVREGGMIKNGFSQEVDDLRDLLNGGASKLAEIEQREKERTGIPKLKVGYNSVFGYYIEITKSFASQVPEDYIR